MSKLSPARRYALEALMEAQGSQVFVRDVLATQRASLGSSADQRDLGFASTLALGVTATSGCLDEVLDAYLAKPGKVSARVRSALRIAAFEMLYLDTPGRVAVSQGVELVRSQARSAVGLANAVLRRVGEGREAYLCAEDVLPEIRQDTAAARQCGLPLWLSRELARSYGDRGCPDAPVSNLVPAPLAVHVNPCSDAGACPADSLSASVLPGCLFANSARELASAGRAEGVQVVSDFHAQLIATAATRSGLCLEIGSGRGTKTFVMASQSRRFGLARRHVALDLSAAKAALNRTRMQASGLDSDITYLAGDARDLDGALAPLDAARERALFDTVFVDAPCSCAGTMRRHPEIPWRLEPRDIETDLPALQLAMLCEAAHRVAPMGELIYSTCSPMLQEDDKVVAAFLNTPAGAEFAVEPVSASSVFERDDMRAACDYVRSCETPAGFFAPLSCAPTDFDAHFCARLVRRG